MTKSTTAFTDAGVEVHNFDCANVTDKILQNLEEVMAVKYRCSAERVFSVNEATEPSLAHGSAYKSPEHFRGYLKTDGHKNQNTHQKGSVISTSTSEKNALMEKN